MDVQKTIRNLKLRGYSVKRFATGKEAADYLAGEISGTTVGIGGCMTAKELGLYDKLSVNNEVFWHWIVPGPETIAKANAAEVYISSANAMTEDGQILNIDGNGNRLAGQVYGRKRLFIVAGTNKICPDFDSALARRDAQRPALRGQEDALQARRQVPRLPQRRPHLQRAAGALGADGRHDERDHTYRRGAGILI